MNKTQTGATSNGKRLVEMKGVSKAFGAVQALNNVNLTLHENEVLGLLGDNAAGKSTLMKILSGAYLPDAGEIFFEGCKAHIESPKDARKLGIEMVYQDLALCGNLDVATNIFLGRWPQKGWFVDAKKMNADSSRILNKLNVDIHSIKLRVETLSGGRQQSVAISRAISFEPKVLIMDEPTANLSAAATARVLQQIRDLKKHGVSVVIISHRMDDVFAVGDRVMVLKRGHNAGERVISQTSENEVLELIVSGELTKELQPDATL